MTRSNDQAMPYVVNDSSEGGYVEQGLTKREYIAIMAMQGLISSGWNGNLNKEHSHIAKKSVELADVLIAELNKPNHE